jgi:hypothetical protein
MILSNVKARCRKCIKNWILFLRRNAEALYWNRHRRQKASVGHVKLVRNADKGLNVAVA